MNEREKAVFPLRVETASGQFRLYDDNGELVTMIDGVAYVAKPDATTFATREKACEIRDALNQGAAPIVSRVARATP